MRSFVAIVASLLLVAAMAAPAAAGRPERSGYSSSWATVTYVSNQDPHAPGTYSRLTIRFAVGTTRTADGTTTFSFVDIFADGWQNDTTSVFNHPWEAGYFVTTTPADPALGQVSPSLADAWAEAGPLTFVCYQGPCPVMPAQISVTASWTATDGQTVVASHPVDDIGAVSSMLVRTRPASASVQFTGGLLYVPPIVVASNLTDQMQIYRAPTP